MGDLQQQQLIGLVTHTHVYGIVADIVSHYKSLTSGLDGRITKLEKSTPGTSIEIADVDDDDAIYAALGVEPEQEETDN